MERKIKLLHVGSIVTLKAVQHYLDEVKIDSMIKEIVNSSIAGGFGASFSSDELYVFERDFDKAKAVLRTFLKE